MKKISHFGEAAYILGLLFLSMGTALMAKSDFGVSMVVAPAYLVSLKVDALTFGTAEYCLQASLFVAMCLVIGKFRLHYCFTFLTVLLYGAALDGWVRIFDLFPGAGLPLRIAFYVIGLPLTSLGVSLMFHSYFPPAVYELFVKMVSARFGRDINRFKIAYDCTSLVVGIGMSFLFFGRFNGIGIGTVIAAVLNGPVIGLFSRTMEKRIDFSPRYPKLAAVFGE